jgi:carbon monoxide dehydrogenase subunit G
MTITLEERIEVPIDIDAAFEYTADFSNIAEWDPGIASSVRVDDGSLGPGSAFDLDVVFAGRTVPMRYVITEYEPGFRVVLVGQGDRITATDTITFGPAESGTMIGYRADIDFRGWMRWIAPVLQSRFDRIGHSAVAGLARALGA